MKKTDEELAQEALKDQAGMLSKAFGLEKEEITEGYDDLWPDPTVDWGLIWKEAVATVGDLPLHGEEAEARYVKETSTVYVFLADHGWSAVSYRKREEAGIDNDIMWWRERIARGLGVDPEELEVTHHQSGGTDPSIVQTVEEIELQRVLTREDVERMYEGIVSAPIHPVYSRGQSRLAEAFGDFIKHQMETPSLARRILPPVEEDN